MVQQLADDEARVFSLGPAEQRMFDRLGTYDPAYVAHEYLGGSFHPMMFDEVAGLLATAKCSYVGSCTPSDAMLATRVPPEMLQLLGAAAPTSRSARPCATWRAAFRFAATCSGVGWSEHTPWTSADGWTS